MRCGYARAPWGVSVLTTIAIWYYNTVDLSSFQNPLVVAIVYLQHNVYDIVILLWKEFKKIVFFVHLSLLPVIIWIGSLQYKHSALQCKRMWKKNPPPGSNNNLANVIQLHTRAREDVIHIIAHSTIGIRMYYIQCMYNVNVFFFPPL